MIKQSWLPIEMILTLAFYKFDEHPQNKNRIRVFTQKLNALTGIDRSANSIDLRIANYVHEDSSNSKGMEGGGKIVKEYWDKYVVSDPELNFLANAYSKFLNEVNIDAILDGKIKSSEDVNLKTKVISTVVYNRSEKVKEDTLNRAGGVCEQCGNNAPFITKDGKPYLEVHHIVPLSQGGKDELLNTKALCPNCHRWFHYGRTN